MPESSGKPPPRNNARGSSVIGTPTLGTTNLPNADLAAQMASSGPVRNAAEAKAYLEQRALVAVNDNFTADTLANVLFSASHEGKLPEHTVSVMKAVGFLIVEKMNVAISEDLAVAVTEKLLEATQSVTKEIERDREFLKSASSEQAKYTQQIAEAAASLNTATQKLDTTTQTLATSTKDIQPAIAAITSADSHIKSLADSAKTLVKVAEEIKSVAATPATSQSTNTQPSYANIAANNSQSSTGAPPTAYNPEQPEYIQRITNRLLISVKQAYISFDPADAKAPKDRGGPAAYQLRTQLNAYMKELDTATDQITDTTGFAIRALQFSDRNAILLEFESVESAKKFRTYCVEHFLLTARICPSAKLQPRTYRVVMKFVPCDGNFDPSDRDHLRHIEEDLNLASNSIITASWIKKPENRAPNQKTANVKVVCSSAETANKLLMERIFISNSRVVVNKDLQEPIRCNKCQEYGHIRENCPNPERCATCAREHPTPTCPNPNDPHCVSCGTTSKHASSDRGKCSQYIKHAASLDSRLPENSMPYFPILNQPWTFVLAPKNTNTASLHTNRPPNSQNRPPQAPNQSNQTHSLPQRPNNSNPRPRTQATLQNAGQFVFPPGFVPPPRQPDQGWQTVQHRGHVPQPPQVNPNALALPQTQQPRIPPSPIPNPLPMQFQTAGQWYDGSLDPYVNSVQHWK